MSNLTSPKKSSKGDFSGNMRTSMSASEPISSRFELEREGKVSYLAYEIDSEGWISLLYTEVAEELRHRGIANELAQIAFEYAKTNSLKVEVICPVAFHFLTKHPEYKPLMVRRPH
jgi:predicted GNAT family acetyltransferase